MMTEMLYILIVMTWLSPEHGKTADGRDMITFDRAVLTHSKPACERLATELRPNYFSVNCYPVTKKCDWFMNNGPADPDCDKH